MASLKPCPFCGNHPNLDYNSENKEYMIYCKYCKKKQHITCSVTNEDFDKTVAIWNEREFDKKLLLEKEEIINWIEEKYKNLKILNGDISKDEYKDNGYYPYEYTYGAFILKNGKILECDTFGHGEIICKYIGINYYENNNIDVESLSIKNKIIKIVIYNNYMSILIPTKLSRKQKDSLYDYIINCKYLNNIIEFGVYNNENLNLKFNNVNDLLLYIDKGTL